LGQEHLFIMIMFGTYSSCHWCKPV